MRTFGRVSEIKEQFPGVWYARVTHTDGGDEESFFLKFKQISQPTMAEIRAMAQTHIFNVNNLPATIPTIPELAPEIAGLTASQQVTLGLIWAFVKVWIRQLIGRA
jgi:hypothetical protein